MSPLRIVLVDDHEMVLQGLTTILGRFLGRVRVVGQALDAVEAQQLTATLKPDIVLCDVRLKGTSGLDLCRKLVERDPAAKVVLLSAYDDEQYLFQAMRVGAKGYLLKQITGEDLVRHLERVADGETAIDASLAGRAGSGVSAAEGEAEAARAMECLDRAVANGYRNTNQLRIESALDPLRNRPDFKKLLAELEKDAPPQQEKR